MMKQSKIKTPVAERGKALSDVLAVLEDIDSAPIALPPFRPTVNVATLTCRETNESDFIVPCRIHMRVTVPDGVDVLTIQWQQDGRIMNTNPCDNIHNVYLTVPGSVRVSVTVMTSEGPFSASRYITGVKA
jgi:hypothetical protein